MRFHVHHWFNSLVMYSCADQWPNQLKADSIEIGDKDYHRAHDGKLYCTRRVVQKCSQCPLHRERVEFQLMPEMRFPEDMREDDES